MNDTYLSFTCPFDPYRGLEGFKELVQPLESLTGS